MGNDKVLCALSGGVDSSVLAHILFKAIKKNVYFVIEYCPDGELFEMIIKKKSFPEDEARVFM